MRQVQTQVSEAKLENVNVHGSLLVLHPLPLPYVKMRLPRDLRDAGT